MAGKTYGRFNARHAAGALAKKVWECTQCECHYYQKHGPKPAQCRACGSMEFIEIPSQTQASRWATLRRDEKAGIIRNLRREVPYKLVAYNRALGMEATVATYVCDAVYEFVDEPGLEIREEVKPAVGVDDLADLKLKWMAAQGLPVTVWMPKR